MEKYNRIKALISLDAVKYNFEQMKKNIKEGTKIIAVIKADAYGHGAVPIAAMLENLDYIWGFATATAQEALQLRREGITRPILILGLVFEEYYEELAREDVRMAVCDYETARKFSEAAASCGKKALIHLAADTGMTRIGFKDSEESLEEIRRIYELDNVEVEGLFTHFARADEYDRTPAMVQLKRYLDFADLLEKNGIINRILILFAMLVIGLTQGMQPIIGYNHGAMKPGRVLLTLKYGVLAGTSFTTLGFLACVFFPRGIAGLFTDDAALISLAANGLTICVLAFPLIGSQIIIGNFFQAIGKARLAIFLSLTRQMLFLLPFLLVLPRFWGQDGVWASLPLADVLSFIVTLLFIRRFLKYYRLKNRHYLDHSTAEA